MKKVNYGFDAPDYTRQAFLIGITLVLAGIAVSYFFSGSFIKYAGYIIILAGIGALITVLMLISYWLKGKFNVRDMMLSKIKWRGDENVLDIGTGRGFLMNGAAKRLTSGKVTGIDIWRAEDLSDNSIENTRLNAEAEGVSDRIEIKNEDAQKMSFADNSFDVILSLLCIHNIEEKDGQRAACFEAARVLKKGGTVLLADYLPTHDYAKYLTEADLTVKSSKSYFKTASFSLMWMVEAVKKVLKEYFVRN